MSSPPRLRVALGALVLAAAAWPSGALAHGDKVPVSRLGSAWDASPLVLGLAGLTLVLFAQAFVRLRRRGRADHASWGRAALFGTAVAVATLALVSPLDPIGEEYLLSAHMLQHVLIADLAPALALVALRGPLTFFMLPAPALRFFAGLRPLRALLRVLLRPWVAFVAWGGVMLGWHVPAAYEVTLHHRAVHDVEHGLFLLVGTLAWIQLVDPARHRRLRPPGRIAFALGLLLIGNPITNALFFDGSPAYPTYARQDERLLGLSALTDQRLAAVVMVVEQLLTLGTCAVILLWPYLRERRPGSLALRRRPA